MLEEPSQTESTMFQQPGLFCLQGCGHYKCVHYAGRIRHIPASHISISHEDLSCMQCQRKAMQQVCVHMLGATAEEEE